MDHEKAITDQAKEEVSYLHKDIVAALSYWIIQQSQVPPSNLHGILKDAREWLFRVDGKPTVSIPGFIWYRSTKKLLRDFIERMVNEVPSIAKLNERSKENDNDFIDLGALSRNITNTLINTPSI